jgi:nitroreductase
METWDAITSRRNVRQFEDRPIEGDVLDRILEAGRRAPSSRNWQPWDFVLVTDRAQLEELSQVGPGAFHAADAAAVVALVMEEFGDQTVRERARYDIGQATMAMMIAAADQGVGSGHIGVQDQPKAREVLRVPEERRVAYLLDFGYPADRPLTPISQPDRRPFDEVVHRGRW